MKTWNGAQSAISAAAICALSLLGALPAAAKDIVHDAEYYILAAQHGDKWAAEDKELDAKLAALEKKYGTPPNIIHIMWDDTPVGEIGIPEIQKCAAGFETPHMNRLAAEGINFMRMYTEPSCTPSRAAAITGRHAVRSGMHTVSFPVEYSGMDADEVTIAEVLSEVWLQRPLSSASGISVIQSPSYMRTTRDMTKRSSRRTTRCPACGSRRPSRPM